jgi:pilus assembly protein CpaB
MNKSRRITLIVAVVLALGTGILTLRYLTSLQQAAPAPTETREVLVAAKDIPARMKITLDMVRAVTRQTAAVDTDTISDPKIAVDAFALITIPAGSLLTMSKLSRSAELAMPVRIPIGMRALTLSGDRVKAVSGFVQPGDRVDIIAIPPRQGGGPPEGVAILRAVLVLAINSTMEQAPGTQAASAQQQQTDTGNPATITVAVTPKEADLLAAVDQTIPLRLALRSPQEPVHSLPAETLMLQGDHAAAPPPPPPLPAAPAMPIEREQPAAAAPIARSAPGVTVIDGDQVVSGK